MNSYEPFVISPQNDINFTAICWHIEFWLHACRTIERPLREHCWFSWVPRAYHVTGYHVSGDITWPYDVITRDGQTWHARGLREGAGFGQTPETDLRGGSISLFAIQFNQIARVTDTQTTGRQTTKSQATHYFQSRTMRNLKSFLVFLFFFSSTLFQTFSTCELFVQDSKCHNTHTF